MGTQSSETDKTVAEGPSGIAYEKQIRECASENDIYRLCSHMAAEFGFECFLIIDIPTDNDRELSKVSLISNFPKSLMAGYDGHDLLVNSPVISHLRTTSEPLVWSTAEIAKLRPKEEQLAARQLFENHNIHHGVSFSNHLPDGSIGSVSFCGASPLKDDTQFLALNYLASLVYERLARIRCTGHSPKEALTDLELKILGMTADGVPPKDVCEQLAFSEQVFNLRFTQILHKMGAKNRMHAIKLAMKHKII